MNKMPATFFQFSAAHSFLIGLLPFFIPVLLVKQGFSIAVLSGFIAITGACFIVAQRVWQCLAIRSMWRLVIAVGCASLVCLVVILLYIDENSHFLLILAAVLNGIYNAFYWTTQRMLFDSMFANSVGKNTGQQFGNFQMLVVVLLKMGVVVGAFFIDNGYLLALFLVCVSWAFLFGIWFTFSDLLNDFNSIEISRSVSSYSLKRSFLFDFKDQIKSRSNFYIDGVFLYLESYFWVVTLYYISQQDIATLGILIVAISITLAVIFYFLKK